MNATNARDRTPISDATAAQIRAERAAAGLSQEAVYTAAGISRSTYLRLESGDRVADVSQLAGICVALGLDLPTFFERAMARVKDHAADDGAVEAPRVRGRGVRAITPKGGSKVYQSRTVGPSV